MRTCIEINDGEFNFESEDCTVRRTDTGDIDIIFSFIKLPEVLVKCATYGVTIDKLKVYDKLWENVKKYLSSYACVVITGTSQGGWQEKIYMKALRIENYFKTHRKVCHKPGCNYPINSIVVMEKLLTMVDEETAENMWNNDIVQFYCCFCFF